MNGGDSRLGPIGGQPFFSGQEASIEDTLLDKLNAPPPNDNFQLTKDFFDSLSPSDAKDLFNQLNAFNNLSQQFNSQFDGPGRAKLLNILQGKFETSPESSDSAPQTLDPKPRGLLKQELDILGSLRQAEIEGFYDDKMVAQSGGTGGTGGASKVFKTRDEALAFAGGANSKDAAVFEDQNHQWHAAKPDAQEWLKGRNQIHQIREDLQNNKISTEDAQAQLNEASRKTLAAALGVSPSDINMVGPNNPADPNKINYDPSLKGKEGTAGAAKLDGKPKAIVIGPDAVKLDNPFDTIDTVAHEASHVRLAADGNKLLEQWQNLKGKKDDFPKWLESQFKQKKISAEVLVSTASAYKGGRNPSEATAYVNGFIAAFGKDRASYQKSLGFQPSDALINSDLSMAASFSPTSNDLTTDEDAAMKKELLGKLEDFYKTLDPDNRKLFDAAMDKAKAQYPNSWIKDFHHTK